MNPYHGHIIGMDSGTFTNTSKTFTMPSWGMYIFVTGHQYNTSDYGMWMCYAASGGNNYITIASSSTVTFSRDKLTCTLTTTGTDTRYFILRL